MEQSLQYCKASRVNFVSKMKTGMRFKIFERRIRTISTTRTTACYFFQKQISRTNKIPQKCIKQTIASSERRLEQVSGYRQTRWKRNNSKDLNCYTNCRNSRICRYSSLHRIQKSNQETNLNLRLAASWSCCHWSSLLGNWPGAWYWVRKQEEALVQAATRTKLRRWLWDWPGQKD